MHCGGKRTLQLYVNKVNKIKLHNPPLREFKECSNSPHRPFRLTSHSHSHTLFENNSMARRLEDMRLLAQETDRLLELAGSSVQGADSDGCRFSSVSDLWAANFDDDAPSRADGDEGEEAWYSNAAVFWNDPEHCPASDDGVLGGFAQVSPADVRETLAFFDQLRELRPTWGRAAALDCAAGIGRVVKHALLHRFDHVDLLEQSKRLLDASVAYIEGGGAADGAAQPPSAEATEQPAAPPPQVVADADAGQGAVAADSGASQAAIPGGSIFEAAAAECESLGRVRRRIHCGMQDLASRAGGDARWDLVWVQWAIGHLTDLDMIDFLQRCRAMLSPGGVICIKENIMGEGSADAFLMDTEDSSLTRSLEYYRCVFQQSGLTVVLEVQQDADDWPEGLLPVYMWALA